MTPDTDFRARKLNPRVEEVFSGDGLWALNKPARVLSHPNPPAREARNAILQVPYNFKAEAFEILGEGRDRPHRVELIHRLDQDTSGLILLSTDPELAAQLKEMFYHREVSKEYRALLRGAPRPAEGVWRDELRKRRKGGQIKVEVVRGGRVNAETRYRVLEKYPGLDVSLVALYPETGRTHQLRVQSASRGHPIAGDERYGDFTWNRQLKAAIGLKRMYLHAHRMVLRHPKTGRKLQLVAPAGKSLDEPTRRLL